MEDALTCDICTERFSSGDLAPLVLKCGHCFCRGCLNNISKQKNFNCPSCNKRQGNVNVHELPINYKLLSIATEVTDFEFELCTSHSDELTHWCNTCLEALCAMCIYDHPRGHELIKGKDLLQKKRTILESKTREWITVTKTTNVKKRQKLVMDLRDLCQSEARLSYSEKVLEELFTEMRQSLSYASIEELETKILSLTLDAEVSGLDVPNTHQNADTSEDAQDKTNERFQMLRGSSINPLCCIQNIDGSSATVYCHEGQLKVSSFGFESPKCDLLFKMPREVFMELSIQDKYLGQVIIKPWYHLRRAQEFVALCLGIFGVSYSGTNFFQVAEKGKPRESLVGGHYCSLKEKKFAEKSLLTDHEWEDGVRGDAHEGIVHGRRTEEDKTWFGICTRSANGLPFKCAFGKVISGLDIVKRAVDHDPVSNVIIRRCGLIEPKP